MKPSLSLISVCLLFVAGSCRKSADLPETACPGLQYAYTSSGWQPGWWPYKLASRVAFGSPRFNPNNGNEIVFVMQDDTKQLQYLTKYDLKSGTLTKLTSLRIGFPQPNWSTNGWIYYGLAHLWRIKSNGDSLGVVSFGGDTLSGSTLVNRHGDRFAYPTQYGTVIFNSDGVVYDTIPLSFNRVPWSYDNTKILHQGFQKGASAETFGYYDIPAKQYHALSSTQYLNTSSDWFPNSSNIAMTDNKGLYKTDLSGNAVKLTTDCSNKVYLWPPYRPTEKRSYTSATPCTLPKMTCFSSTPIYA